MQTYLKTKSSWVQLLLFVGLAMAAFVIAMLIGSVVLSQITGINMLTLQDPKNFDLANPAMLTFIRGLILVQFLFLFLGPSLFFAYLSDPKPMNYLGLKQPGAPVYWLLGILLIVVAYPFVEYIGYLNQKISLGAGTNKWMKGMEDEAARQIQFMLKNRTLGELLKNLVFISLFAGIGEELFFRGVLQRIFIRMTKDPWMGIVLTAAIFSAIHFQFYGFFPRFLLGILSGAIYWYSGSLWTAILAHFLYDASVIVFLYFNPQLLNSSDASIIKGQDVQLLAGALVSLGLTIFLMVQMRRRSTTRYHEIYKDDTPPPDAFSF